MTNRKLKELAGNEVTEMRDKKPLPVGIDDFRKIIEEDYYYLDRRYTARQGRSNTVYTTEKVWKNA